MRIAGSRHMFSGLRAETNDFTIVQTDGMWTVQSHVYVDLVIMVGMIFEAAYGRRF